jgi:hypothetical protein
LSLSFVCETLGLSCLVCETLGLEFVCNALGLGLLFCDLLSFPLAYTIIVPKTLSIHNLFTCGFGSTLKAQCGCTCHDT